MKVGTTEPRDPRTLPKRTDTKCREARAAASLTITSASPLVAPMIEVGRTALSVEINTRCVTSNSTDASTTFRVPSTLFVIASTTFSSISGTCLCAAAWKTANGLNRSKVRLRRV